MKSLSVCIPTYEMNGRGAEFLRYSLEILTHQTFKDFDVVVSDHSTSNIIKDVCDSFSKKLDLHYFQNPNDRGSSSANLNNAIKHASGKLVKFLFQDDFFYSPTSLQDIVEQFDIATDRWLVTACEHSRDGRTFYHPFFPKYNPQIHLGKNTISSPSVLTIKNDKPLLFDEHLIWLMDCDYYKRCYDRYGEPKVLNNINVVNRTGEHQVSLIMATKELRKREYDYVVKKFKVRFTFWQKISGAVSHLFQS